MRNLLKNNIEYTIGLFVLIVSYVLRYIIENNYLEGNVYYFLRHKALPFVFWGLIIIGISILLYGSIKKKHLQNALISFNHPVVYNAIITILITLIAINQEYTNRYTPVIIIMFLYSIALIVIRKNIQYIFPFVFFTVLVISYILVQPPQPVGYIIAVISVSCLAAELFFIVRWVVIHFRKQATHQDTIMIKNILLFFIVPFLLIADVYANYNDLIFVLVYATVIFINIHFLFVIGKEIKVLFTGHKDSKREENESGNI